jgi:hypothetical protein
LPSLAIFSFSAIDMGLALLAILMVGSESPQPARRGNASYGSFASFPRCNRDVCVTPDDGHRSASESEVSPSIILPAAISEHS